MYPPPKGSVFRWHERKDEDREKYLNILTELDNIPNGEKPLIRDVHANCNQSYFWADEHNSVIKQKSLGQSIMISHFIEEVDGFLTFEGHSACVSLEIQKMGTLIMTS